MPRLLVIDDEPNVLYSLEESLRSHILDVLTPECLSETLRDWTPANGTGAVEAVANFDLSAHVQRLLHSGEADIYRKACDAANRVILEAILRHTHGNQVQASELLGISRTTLRAKMKALRMIVEKQLLPEADAG